LLNQSGEIAHLLEDDVAEDQEGIYLAQQSVGEKKDWPNPDLVDF